MYYAAPARRPAAPESSSSRRLRRSTVQRERWAFLRSRWLSGTEILLARGSPPSRFYTERYAVSICGSAGRHRTSRDGSRRDERGCQARLLQSGEVFVDENGCYCSGFRAVFIEPGLIDATAQELGFSHAPRFRTTRSADGRLLAAVGGLCAAIEGHAAAAEQQSRLTTTLQCMLDLMSESHPPAWSSHRPIARARDHLRRKFDGTVTLDELADVARLSRYHLLRSFSALVGLTPHAYQMRLRIERAMSLLRSGLPASTVAGLTGFADQSHLTRQFRHLLRLTPAEYARAAGSQL